MHVDATRPILLVTLGGAVVSIVVCAAAIQRVGRAPTLDPAPTSCATTVSSEESIALAESEVARTVCAVRASPTPTESEAVARSTAQRPSTRSKERDLREAFVALERATPGTLDARAAAILGGRGPTTEKVALLRALRDTASPSTSRWLDAGVRAAPTAPIAAMQSLAEFALEQLTELALDDSAARDLLGELAFDADHVAIDLRRRACAGFAALCPSERVPELSAQLWREQDQLVIASAVAALEPRSSDPQVRRVLMLYEHARPESLVDDSSN